MAKVEQLTRGQNPPEDQDWILVEAGAREGFFVTRSIQTAEKEVSVSRSTALSSAKTAFDLAQQWADEFGIDVIHSKGVLEH